ncbi:MAG: DNA polymerase III subunit beta [Candidatus Palauibacterales bacterium]|nr:DNA polymerase III subunit beta [Candidatus Palauibacterales bacterium]MDP2530986.1 DNA polymerase III subunit beta [Candidatus Palauibacterales bacterium]MDP2583429.1 DNA polymerase III subunit beta [Candidatus Palauibacterales bacterium]
MRLSITREKLQEGLGAVAATIPNKTTLPVLSNILLRAQGARLEMSGTDLDISVSVGVDAEVEQAGAITVPARKISDIARELESAPVHLVADGDQIELSCGKSRFKLFGLPEGEFPSFPEVDFSESWKVTAGTLQELIGHTAFAASTEESRPILNGVLWQLRSDHCTMVATNGHRLARMTFPLEEVDAPEADLIVPPKALQQVERLFEADEEVEVARSENHLAFRSATRVVYTRLIEGPYPNYEQVIPSDNDKQAVGSTGALEKAIRRMAVVASDQTHRVRLSFSEGTLGFRVQTPDLGEAEDEVSVDYQGETLEIGFNANYLLEVLRYMPDEDVRIEFRAPERAATFRPAGGEPDYLCLVMPLRLLD